MNAEELIITLNKIKELILIEPRIAADMITLLNKELEREDFFMKSEVKEKITRLAKEFWSDDFYFKMLKEFE